MKITLNPIKWFIIVLSLFLPPLLAANESWFCTEESAKRNGNIISVCGVGESMNDEGYARKRALNNALAEFKELCEMSADCANHPLSAEPKRTTCAQKENGIVKCYRLVEITIGQ